MGTPLYAGPEVYLNKYDENYSERCDVWGAGMILYEMLTGKLLFQNVNVLPGPLRPSKSSSTSGNSTRTGNDV
jgi:serine/threonine protein kinase